ncbi:LysR family transcriptional regulator [Ideonella dechloratans]|uniref:LysR family transcriptional regulator n=1 Tax=Ideonella dechloratans TaxID=36863 RepID=UPI0035B2FD90
MDLTHRLVEVFRAVMRTGHVTRAAELLHTSQPTVSRELARLEQVLGLVLFERVKGRLRPTAQAQVLLEEVDRSYEGLERIAATAFNLRDAGAVRLQVACLPALAHALLPRAVALYRQRRPTAAVALVPLESPQLEGTLTEQRHDLGLIEQREPPPGCELSTLLVADEVCVLPPGHALAGRRLITPADLAGQSFISLAPTDPYRQQVDAVFAQAGVVRQLQLETPSALSVCALVRQGLGVAIVNPLTALEMAASQALQVRPFSVSIPFHLGKVLPQWRPAHPLRAEFEQALAAAVEELRVQLARLG